MLLLSLRFRSPSFLRLCFWRLPTFHLDDKVENFLVLTSDLWDLVIIVIQEDDPIYILFFFFFFDMVES